jgi:hypothetical protein
VTTTCDGVDGRFVSKSTIVWELGAPGIAKVIKGKMTTSDEDTVSGSGPDTCSYDLTYTLQE